MSAFVAIAANWMATIIKTIYPHQRQPIREEEPFIRHMTIHASQLKGRNLLIIGDVHGCIDEMLELIKQAQNRAPQRPLTVVFVGDLVRKGPHSLQVLRYVRTTDHTYTVRGNHEEKVVKSIIKWKTTGKHTLTSQYDHKWINQLQNEDFEYLKSLPYTISIPCLNITCVHGGLVPGVAVTSQIPDVIMTMKEMTYDTDHWFHGENHIRPCKNDEVGQPWSTIWCGPQHIYFGHDATRLLQETKFATGLDTGCVYGGHLTGCLLRLNDHTNTVTCQNKQIIRLKAFKQYRKIKTTTM